MRAARGMSGNQSAYCGKKGIVPQTLHQGEDNLRILLADDDPVTRRMLQAALSDWGHDVLTCADGSEAWEELQKEDRPKLAILDWTMPEMDGPTICAKLREQIDRPYTYVILVTSRDSKEDLLEGLEAGTDDYITKPFDRTELRLRLSVGERIVRLQDELISARDDFEYQAAHDSLTGLWNRRAVLATLKGELARAQRKGSRLSVVIGDLDHFKGVNDNLGHLMGDAVLRAVAERINESIRAYDSLGRYGGEEFILVLPDCGLQDAKAQAERIRSRLCAEPISAGEGSVAVTISLGVAEAIQTEDWSVDAVIRAADTALYNAKNLGRNRVELAHAPGERDHSDP